MGRIATPAPGMLVMGIIAQESGPIHQAMDAFQDGFGGIALWEGPFPFSPFTAYYHPEMGEPLYRWFASFADLVRPDRLIAAKVRAIQVETALAVSGRRRINLDPGFLHPSKLVLSTTKDHAHRIYVAEGIYAEVTLLFADGDWHPLPWTYPDYRSEPYKEAFHRMRAECLMRLRSSRGQEGRMP